MSSPVLAVARDLAADTAQEAAGIAVDSVELMRKQWENFTTEDPNKQTEEQVRKVETKAAQVNQDLAGANLPGIDAETLRREILVGKSSSEIIREAKEAADSKVNKAYDYMEQLKRQLRDGVNDPNLKDPEKIKETQVDEVVIGEMGVGSQGLSTAAALKAKIWGEAELNNTREKKLEEAGLVEKPGKVFSLDKARKGTRVFHAVEADVKAA